MRTAAQVAADIETTRDLLILADTAQDWTEGDTHLNHLRDLWTEYQLLPHPRLPSEADGHRAPRAY